MGARPGPRDAAGGIHDEGRRCSSRTVPCRGVRRSGNVEHPGSDQRAEGQQGGGGIAPRGGDQPGPPELVTVEFGKSVDEPVQQIGGDVRFAVPGGIQGGVGQSEVGGQVHDGADRGDQVGHQMLGLAVGKGQEHQVQTVQLPRFGRAHSGDGDRPRPGKGCTRPRPGPDERLPWPRRRRTRGGRRTAGAVRHRRSRRPPRRLPSWSLAHAVLRAVRLSSVPGRVVAFAHRSHRSVASICMIMHSYANKTDRAPRIRNDRPGPGHGVLTTPDETLILTDLGTPASAQATDSGRAPARVSTGSIDPRRQAVVRRGRAATRDRKGGKPGGLGSVR